jgi:DNA-binding PadR family transcriptional regulator
MATRSRAPAAVLPEENWGDRVFQGEVKTKTVFPMLVLQMLHVQPDSGYGLMQRIGELGGIFPVNPNTVYPLLRRLEERGFISGEIDETTKRGTTVYRITPDGEDRLQSIKSGFLPYLTNLIEALQKLRNDLYGDTTSSN